MTAIRPSLPVHVAQHVEALIRDGTWAQRLPSERNLAIELGISRGTLRAALALLRSSGKLTGSPQGNLLPPNSPPLALATREIELGVLSPRPLEPLRPYLAMLVGHLKEGAQARGWKLHLHHGGSYFSRYPAKPLRQLVANYRHHCWILVHSTPKTQSWFEREQIPALISGHACIGIHLPSVDVNHRAAGRHLGIMLRRYGHQHIVIISSRPSLPGLVEGETGIREGMQERDGDVGKVDALHYDGDDPRLAHKILRCLEAAAHPTCIVTETPNQYLTALTALASAKITVPAEISLVSRLDDPFLHHLIPAPSRYHVNPSTMAGHILTRLAHLVVGEKLRSPVHEVIPEFIPGASLRRWHP